MNCPTCKRIVASNASACPNCGHDFAKQRQQEAIAYAFIAAIIVAALVVAAFIVLLPGIMINTFRGRYKTRQRNLVAEAVRDPQTYLISLPIAALTFLILYLSGVFSSPSPPRVAAMETSTLATNERNEVRRAIAVSSPTFSTGGQPSVTPVKSPNTYFTPSPTGSPFDVPYVVAGIRPGDALNVRSGPDSRYPILERLPNGFGDIHILAPPVINGTTEWVNISFAGRTGWVNREYLRRP